MDDLISRQMLLEYIHGEPVGRLLCDKYNLDGLIEQLPPAQPKRGKWNYNSKIGTFKVWTCDQCGWNYEAEFNFCPNCGARMEVTE